MRLTVSRQMYGSSGMLRPGQEFEASDRAARTLIGRGLARPVDPDPEPAALAAVRRAIEDAEKGLHAPAATATAS
jgi:hypothetical protein